MDNLINVQERRGLRVFVAALILLIAGVLLSMKLGAVPLTWSELYQIIMGGDTSKIGQIIMTIRLPRVVVGFLAGMNLALAGVILQGILRNPLADPGIIGITSGGALAAMIIMILMPTYVMLVPIGAFIGALVASFLVYGISWQGGLNPLRLILAGVAVAAFFGGFNTILSVFYPDRVQGTVSWMAGGFVGRSWDDVMMIWPYTAIGIIGSMISIRWLTLLSLGDDTARTLGVHVERCRLSLLVLASLLAASAVFVMFEFALVKLRPTRIKEIAEDGNKTAKILLKMVDQLDHYLSATQLGITIVSLGLGWLGESTFHALFNPIFEVFKLNETLTHTISLVVSFGFMTLLHVVLGELVPKTIAIQSAEKTCFKVAWPMYWFDKVMRPLVWILIH